MTTATLSGMPPPRTRDYFARIPVRLLDDDRLTMADIRVHRYALAHRDADGACRAKTAKIAHDLALDPGTINRSLGRLRRLHPPGLDHPYIEVRGGTHSRAIWPRYTPLEPGERASTIRSKRARNCMDAARANASNSKRNSRASEGVAPTPLFRTKCERNEEHVDVIHLPGNPPACVREAPDPRPPEPGHPQPPPGPAVAPGFVREPVRAPIPAGPEPGKRPLPPIAAPDPRAATAAGIARRLQALQERAEAEEVREAVRAVERGAAGPQTAETAAARRMAAPGPAPVPGPHVETPDLIRRLKSQGAAVVALVVARLCERLDPDFGPCYRRCCADVLAGRLEVGAMVAAFHWARNAPGRGVARGPAFAAYMARHRETRAADRGAMHRRE